MSERKGFCVFLWLILLTLAISALTACQRGITITLPCRDESAFVDFSEVDTFAFFDGHIRLTEEAADIKLPRGQTASLGIVGRPYTEYHLNVILASGPSRARGLGYTESDAYGYADWTWFVSANTRPGRVSAIITGGGDRLILDILITE